MRPFCLTNARQLRSVALKFPHPSVDDTCSIPSVTCIQWKCGLFHWSAGTLSLHPLFIVSWSWYFAIKQGLHVFWRCRPRLCLSVQGEFVGLRLDSSLSLLPILLSLSSEFCFSAFSPTFFSELPIYSTFIFTLFEFFRILNFNAVFCFYAVKITLYRNISLSYIKLNYVAQFFSSPSYYVWGTLVIVQIFDFRCLTDWHVLGSGESKKYKISMVSGVR